MQMFTHQKKCNFYFLWLGLRNRWIWLKFPPPPWSIEIFAMPISNSIVFYWMQHTTMNCFSYMHIYRGGLIDWWIACQCGFSTGERLNDSDWLTPLLLYAGKEYECYQPLWFHQRRDSVTGETNFVYKGGYWEAKERQDWSMCPDIF